MPLFSNHPSRVSFKMHENGIKNGCIYAQQCFSESFQTLSMKNKLSYVNMEVSQQKLSPSKWRKFLIYFHANSQQTKTMFFYTLTHASNKKTSLLTYSIIMKKLCVLFVLQNTNFHCQNKNSNKCS